jgi:PST family polysaccharide transporter
MDLIRTSLLNGIAVTVRMGTGLVLNKIMAVYVGPAGYAVVGQFQNVAAMIIAFASGTLATGVTKYTAQYHSDTGQRTTLWRTAGTLTVACSFLAAAIVFGFRESLAKRLLLDPGLSDVFAWLAVSLVFISINSLLLAILNGLKETRRYVAANILGALLSLAVSAILITAWGLRGALVALSVSQGSALLLTLVVCRRMVWFQAKNLWGTVDPGIAASLGRFVLMAVASVMTLPLSQILIRQKIVDELGIEHAGYWDALIKLSNTYLALATTTLSLYLLPRLSELATMAHVRREVWKSWQVIVPATVLASMVVYLFRDWVVVTIFTPEFLPMLELLAWQLCGDVIKMTSWVLGYVLIARARSAEFITAEIVFALALWALTLMGIRLFGFRGISMAYAATYAIYLAAMYFLVMRQRLGSPEQA